MDITGVSGRGRGRPGRGTSVNLGDQAGNNTIGSLGRATSVCDQVINKTIVRGRGIIIGSAYVRDTGIGRGRNRGQVVADGFVQATLSNLPTVSCFNVAEYYKNLLSPELLHAKDVRSAGADYGDNAIGYVKLKRNQSACTVQASITPETSVNNVPYAVSGNVDETKKIISNAICNCQASAGNFLKRLVK